MLEARATLTDGASRTGMALSVSSLPWPCYVCSALLCCTAHPTVAALKSADKMIRSGERLGCDESGRPPKLEGTTSSMVFSHIRASSLGKAALPSEENSHPFVFSSGGHALSFMHNGNVARFTSERKARWRESLPPLLRSQIVGGTDSEHLGAVVFSTFLSFLDSGGVDGEAGSGGGDRDDHLASSLVSAVETVLGSIAAEDQAAESFSSVNLAASLGDSVLVVARFRSGKEDPPSLYAHTGAKVCSWHSCAKLGAQ